VAKDYPGVENMSSADKSDTFPFVHAIAMASSELMRSWKRTDGFLREARAHLSELAEGLCAGEIHEFEKYLEHNELELALDMLEVAFEKTGVETWRVLELMALAAASMQMLERQQRYDAQLLKARGWKYETVMPK
jgi:hypothetical protein